MKKLFNACISLLLIVSLSGMIGCSSEEISFRYENDDTIRQLIDAEAPDYPDMEFMVFSDAHLYSSSLGVEGEAFQKYLDSDRKLLAESEAILAEMTDIVIDATPDFVIVPGDLTKDGELICHELFIEYLEEIEGNGISTYVIPGNHDIANPDAHSYDGDTVTEVDSISALQFHDMYREFGYNEAVSEDEHSLSYIAEPISGLWLFALDSCRYSENDDEPVVGGSFSAATLSWIESMLIEANQDGKAVIAMMHHGVLEHFEGQADSFEEYVIEDYEDISEMLAEYNVRMVFTGHYHAQDVVSMTTEETEKQLYDIETGSLVTYPNPYRTVKITDGTEVEISSGHITSIEGYETGFPEYSKEYVTEGLQNIGLDMLDDYGLTGDKAQVIVGQIADAGLAHYTGDETLPEGEVAVTSEGSGIIGWFVVLFRGDLLRSMWRDLPPADNDLHISFAVR